MSATLVILRVNGGQLICPFKVYARNQNAAMVCARLHLMSKTGLQVI